MFSYRRDTYDEIDILSMAEDGMGKGKEARPMHSWNIRRRDGRKVKSKHAHRFLVCLREGCCTVGNQFQVFFSFVLHCIAFNPESLLAASKPVS